MDPRGFGFRQRAEEIGQGAMAVVYRAHHQALRRDLAVKELKAEFLNDAQVKERFEREALAVAVLHHENIVHVVDLVMDDGAPYIVLEYIDGTNLFDLLARVERLPPDVAAAIAVQLARGLELAHFRGLVHRDLKPSNIIVGRQGTAKIMDFGIARAEAMGDLTRPGVALGTPSYMSPEQIMGERVDWRSDVFSFGIVIYQMLTGRKPFRETETTSVMQAIMKERYTPIRELFPDVPRALVSVVKRCLHKEPSQRYPSTEHLRDDLERVTKALVNVGLRERVAVYLYHRQLATTADLTETSAAALLEDDKLERIDALEAAPWRAPRHRGGILALVVAGTAALLLALWQGDVDGVLRRAPLSTVEAGDLRVNVWPWAEVFIDDQYFDTTPFAQAARLPAGPHTLTLRNPHFRAEQRDVQIAPHQVTVVDVELTEPMRSTP